METVDVVPFVVSLCDGFLLCFYSSISYLVPCGTITRHKFNFSNRTGWLGSVVVKASDL